MSVHHQNKKVITPLCIALYKIDGEKHRKALLQSYVSKDKLCLGHTFHCVEVAENLWISDATVLPTVTSTNANRFGIMIGQKYAKFILEDAA